MNFGWTTNRRLLVACVISTSALHGKADWPTYRGDRFRSAYTAETLPEDLRLAWTHYPTAPPLPAWPLPDAGANDWEKRDDVRDPVYEEGRMPFDRVFHPVASRGKVYFGSSSDCRVYALDLGSGQVLWQFATDAPVRVAPVVHRDHVYAASDDGHLYCLEADSGRLSWRVFGGPAGRETEMILANGRLASRWPARGGPVADGDTVYFAAGVWPSEGVFVHALDCETGGTKWINAEAATTPTRQPKAGDWVESGVSAQGHLVLTDDALIVPTGRSLPAVFDRETGTLDNFRLSPQGDHSDNDRSTTGVGGTETMASGKLFFNTGRMLEVKTGNVQRMIGLGQYAGLPSGIVRAFRGRLTRHDWKTDQDRGVRRLVPAVDKKDFDARYALIVADRMAIGGGDGQIVIASLDEAEAQPLISFAVDGAVYGLAVSDQCLLAATDRGAIYCFAKGASGVDPAESDSANDSAELEAPAEQPDGYVLDLGSNDGSLSLRFANEFPTRHIYSVVEDADDAVALRSRLASAGLSHRVTVHARPLSHTGYPDYFADLVVSNKSILAALTLDETREAKRLTRPCGGVSILGDPDTTEPTLRGPLVGAGAWTHQYANPANTLCSGDPVSGPLRPLWYRQVEQPPLNRHGRGPAPLYYDGLLYSLARDSLVAVDAYNGVLRWKLDLPGVMTHHDVSGGATFVGVNITHGYMCVGEEGLFLRSGGECLVIEPRTGELLRRLQAPHGSDDSAPVWGFLALHQGVLIGSVANPNHFVQNKAGNNRLGSDAAELKFSESDGLFGCDPGTGEIFWRYLPEHSIRNNSIAIGGGSVYVIDRPIANFDRYDLPVAQGAYHPPGELIRLDIHDGSVLRRTPREVLGTTLALDTSCNVLMVSYQPGATWGDGAPSDQDSERRIWAYDAESLRINWTKSIDYSEKPVLVDGYAVIGGGSFKGRKTGAKIDLRTGGVTPLNLVRHYGCGAMAAGKNLFMFRSNTIGYYDLKDDEAGVRHFGGIRPGCWINMIPAGGLVLAPDGSSGCTCSYQVGRTWIAFQGSSEPLAITDELSRLED